MGAARNATFLWAVIASSLLVSHAQAATQESVTTIFLTRKSDSTAREAPDVSLLSYAVAMGSLMERSHFLTEEKIARGVRAHSAGKRVLYIYLSVDDAEHTTFAEVTEKLDRLKLAIKGNVAEKCKVEIHVFPKVRVHYAETEKLND